MNAFKMVTLSVIFLLLLMISVVSFMREVSESGVPFLLLVAMVVPELLVGFFLGYLEFSKEKSKYTLSTMWGILRFEFIGFMVIVPFGICAFHFLTTGSTIASPGLAFMLAFGLGNLCFHKKMA